MKVVLAPGDKLTIAFQDHGITIRGSVTLSFSEEDEILTLEGSWPDEAGNRGVLYHSSKQVVFADAMSNKE